MRKRILAATIVLAAAAVALFWGLFWRDATARRGALEWTKASGERPWLQDVSTWAVSVDLSKQRPSESDLGSFTIGNARVFTALGLTLPLNTWNNILGPTYQKETGFLGHDLIGLRINGRDVACPKQSVERIRRSGIVRTRLAGDGYVLETLDFAPPELRAIVRLITIRNLSPKAFRAEAVIHVQGLVPAPEESPGLLRRGMFRILMHVRGDGARPRLGQYKIGPDGTPSTDTGVPMGITATVPFGRIAPKESRTKMHCLAISGDVRAERETLGRVEAEGLALLDQTREWWQKWHEGQIALQCPDARLVDLLDDTKDVIKTQQAAGGGYSPMHLYSYCWARDSNGPIRYMLRCGEFEDVQRALDYYYQASARKGRIGMNLPLDVPITGETPKVQWGMVPVEPAEVPSFLVLQQYWHYRYSGDLRPIAAHWEYLARNIHGQQVSRDGRLPFHGDETYRFPGYAIWLASHTEPTDYLELDNLFSADSAFAYVAAAEAMSEMAAALGRGSEAAYFGGLARGVREATERTYWQPELGFYAPASSRFSQCLYRYPFANINLEPLWVGYLPSDSPTAQQNALNALSYLWRQDGTADTTPSFGFATGMTPGMVLHNLAAIDHAAAETALRGVIEAFSPAAEMAEMLEPDNRPSRGVWGERRARPWEGGINAEAILYYLSGFEPNAPRGEAKLCPRLPFGWQQMDIRDMRLGDNRLAVSASARAGHRRYRVTNAGSRPVRVDLVISLPECDIRRILVRGQPWEPAGRPVARYGRTRQHVPLALGPNDEAEVVVEHGTPVASETGRIRRRPFRYPAPDVGAARVVVVTLRRSTANRWRNRDPNAFVLDSYIAFPPSYVREALLTPDGRQRRVEMLVLDVDDWPGAFKLEGFWSTGPGGRIVRAFQQLGGQVVREKPPRGETAKQLPLSPGSSFETEEEPD